MVDVVVVGGSVVVVVEVVVVVGIGSEATVEEGDAVAAPSATPPVEVPPHEATSAMTANSQTVRLRLSRIFAPFLSLRGCGKARLLAIGDVPHPRVNNREDFSLTRAKNTPRNRRPGGRTG
jgi:hypothetical protein